MRQSWCQSCCERVEFDDAVRFTVSLGERSGFGCPTCNAELEFPACPSCGKRGRHCCICDATGSDCRVYVDANVTGMACERHVPCRCCACGARGDDMEQVDDDRFACGTCAPLVCPGCDAEDGWDCDAVDVRDPATYGRSCGGAS